MAGKRTQRHAPPMDLTPSITEFVGVRASFYVARFNRLLCGQMAWRVNMPALIFGPLWAAARGLWAFFWLFAVLELMAWVQISRGLWGDLGADKLAEAARLQAKSDQLMAEAARDTSDTRAPVLLESAENLARAAKNALAAGEVAAESATTYLIVGLLLLGLFKLTGGAFRRLGLQTPVHPMARE